jgi:ATP-dependent RNA helicase HrpB
VAEPLPIDPHIESIIAHVRETRAVIVTAQPGTGKTTRVPPALVPDGPVILLQPRRVAARAIAQRIAGEQGWTLGRQIGWQVRFERRFSAATRLLVVTEGVLTARLQSDPLLSDFLTVVIDEFHERSLNVDLALALAKQAWLARHDLRLVVMSATLDAGAVSAFLGGCPIVTVPGRLFPIDIRHAEHQSVSTAAVEALATSTGDVLCFLAGASEIRHVCTELDGIIDRATVDLVRLHGSLESSDQDAALRPSSSRRRIVVATNIAETSVTVHGVTAVVDSGFHKVARYDTERAIDSLSRERITADAAAQRAGRAGRVAPGVVWRLWNARDRLRPHREPEIHRVDLSAAILDIVSWGGNPWTLEWFERPREEAIQSAEHLLERLGALHEGKLTDIGDQIRRLPLHPRLARMLIAAGGAPEMARTCAFLSERHFIPPRSLSTSSDLLSVIDDWDNATPHVKRAAREIENIIRAAPLIERQFGIAGGLDEAAFRRAVLAGYPDRVGHRRGPGSPRVRLVSGSGASVGGESGVRDGEFLVAVDLQAAPHEARIRVASRVEREWLEPTHSEVVHHFDRESGVVRATRVDYYGALVLAEHPTDPDPELTTDLLVDAWLARGPRADDAQILRRLKFAGQTIEVEDLVRTAARAVASLDEVKLGAALTADLERAMNRDAPQSIRLPSGRTARLDYLADGGVAASVKLQELFGLPETPRLGPRREPVLFSLLAPSGRPVQVTRDLRSFWDRTYPEVRKELRGRYPKHPWPDDPWQATPTARVKRR